MPALQFDRRALPDGLIVDHVPMADGWRLRRMMWPALAGAARGDLLFLTGRADFGEKYLEAMAHWQGRGWRVTSFDWRGQGGSAGGGDAPEPAFDTLLDDLAEMIGAGGGGGPSVVVAHSMGGHLALRLMAERGWRPAATVLAAPMLGIATGPIPPGIAAGLAHGAVGLGLGNRRVWRHRGVGTMRQATLTGDAERYADEGWWTARHPGFAPLPPRWAWLDAAFRSIAALTRAPLEGVDVPILLLVAARDRLVREPAIAAAAARLPRARILRFEAAHELLRETDAVRDAALGAIDAFLDEMAPA